MCVNDNSATAVYVVPVIFIQECTIVAKTQPNLWGTGIRVETLGETRLEKSSAWQTNWNGNENEKKVEVETDT